MKRSVFRAGSRSTGSEQPLLRREQEGMPECVALFALFRPGGYELQVVIGNVPGETYPGMRRCAGTVGCAAVFAYAFP